MGGGLAPIPAPHIHPHKYRPHGPIAKTIPPVLKKSRRKAQSPKPRAQLDTAPEAPISKSADYLKILSATGFNGRQVWKPARQQTWKSAAPGFRPVATGGSAKMRPEAETGEGRPNAVGTAGRAGGQGENYW